VLGAGSIGCLWAAQWQLDQRPCTLIGRSRPEKPLLSLTHKNTTQCWPQKWQDLSADDVISHLLITTKAHQCQAALNSVRHRLSKDAIIMILQNGMAATEIELAPTQQLLAATTTDGAYLEQTGHVVYAGVGKTLIGSLSKQQSLGSLLKTLPSGLSILETDDITQQLWYKLAINCAINPLTVIYQCRNGELLHNCAALTDIDQLCAEIKTVASKLMPQLDLSGLVQEVHHVCTITRHNISSMRQDIEHGRRTEINQLNGYLLRQAQQLGLKLPANQAVTEQILRIEAKFSSML
jgi:2-dehydropantoate 2-reductase